VIRRLVVAALCALAVSAAGALYAHAGEAGPAASFRTPNAGAACRLAGRTLVCSSLATSQSLALRAHGAPAVVRPLPWWDASTPVLTHWKRGRVSCDLDGATIVCRNGAAAFAVGGGGFSVAR
jgi:hypothetical protein